MRFWLLIVAVACGGTNAKNNAGGGTVVDAPNPEDGDADDGGTGDDGGSGDDGGTGDDGGSSDDGDDSADPSDSGEPEDTGDATVDEECRDVPLITYSSFGQGFLTFYCQGCHGSGAPVRQGAPESVSFDDHDEALAWMERIYVRTYESRTMPPALGVFDEDLEKLRIWIRCWDGQ